MSLPNLPKVQAFQAALPDKAKRSPSFRFYSLYDKLCRADVRWVAFKRCQLNDGAPGVDRSASGGFADIAKSGEQQWLDELAEELRMKTSCPSAVRRVWFPKPDGKLSAFGGLGLPTIKDRVVQTAAVLVLEPILEADLQPESARGGPTERNGVRWTRSTRSIVW